MSTPAKKTDLGSSNEWATPRALFAKLDERFAFTLDAAASRWNAKCAAYFTKRQNGLKQRWSGRVWLNPPYGPGQLAAWLSKARREVLFRQCELACCLVPAYTGEGWWHDNVEAPAGKLLMSDHWLDELGAHTMLEWTELRVTWTRIRGRLSFVEESGATGSARFSSALVLFQRPRNRR